MSSGGSGTDVPWLDHDERAAWRGYVESIHSIQADLEDELLGSHGLGVGDYGVLVHLSEAPDQRLRMCDLAGRLRLSPSGLTRRLDGLVRDGLVAREPAPDDRRVSLAVLTPNGRRTLEASAPTHVAGVRRHFLDHLTPTQIRQLGAAFTALVAKRDAERGVAI